MAQETYPLTAGMAVKLARIRRGMTQEQLAREIKMDRVRLSKIEKGQLVNIRMDEAAEFELLLGVDPRLWLQAAGCEVPA